MLLVSTIVSFGRCGPFVEYQPSRKSICLSRPGAVVISYLVQLPREEDWKGKLRSFQHFKFLNPPSVLFDLLCFLFVHFESKSRLLQEGLPCLSFLSFSTRCQAGLNLRQGWSVVVGDLTCPTIAVIDVQR
ncbi:hypothetical protein Tsp_13238 [Trichinella spiralis]|uniref:hypothetical protein n=1 Tax=Trichinella spiralis TaxID=6334 RepID=UPI0001EFE403|nr:hypothetical protein Tsp_13238 [Trichinella spiralis]